MTKKIVGNATFGLHSRPLPHEPNLSEPAFAYVLAIGDLRFAEQMVAEHAVPWMTDAKEAWKFVQAKRDAAMDIWDNLSSDDQQAALDHVAKKGDR